MNEKSERYKIWCDLVGVISGRDNLSLNDALLAIREFVSDPDINNCIIIDKVSKDAEVIKGSINPFKKELDKKFSGWKLGKIEK